MANRVLNAVTSFALNTKADNIPPASRDFMALLLLDTLGIAAAATPMEAGVIARDTAHLLYNSADPKFTARMMFDDRSASLAGAAFATATQIDNLDGHDGYNPTKGHIGVAVVPAFAALAEHTDLSGPDALAALIISYEIAGRAAIALHGSVEDYHTSGAWNGLGVAAMAARLRGHSADQLRESLGIAEYHGPRSQMMREIANPTMLHDGSGMGAFVGLSAALMAERGFTGAPAVTVEATEVAHAWADLGQLWQTDLQYIKPYPICRWAHGAIDATRAILLDHPLKTDQIKAIRIHSFHNAVQLYPAMPDSTSQAQYSLPFAVAVMIKHGAIGLDHISGDGLRDADIAALVGKTELVEEPRHEARYPLARWAHVEIELADGTVLQSGDTHARGGPEVPFSRDDILAKYDQFATPVLGQSRANGLRDAVLNLTDPSSRFASLSPFLYGSA